MIMKVTFKFILFFIVVTFIASLYLCWIDYHFIYGNLAMWPTADTLTLIELTMVLSLIIAVILWRFLRAYDKAIERILHGETLTPQERTQTMNCYNKAVWVIIIANALGFCIGKIIMTVLLISRFPEMNPKALGNLTLGFIQSFMIGIIAALYETLVLNIMMAKSRGLLKIRHTSEFGKGFYISLTGKILLVAFASFIFIGCNSFLSSFFIVSNQSESMLPVYYEKGFEAFLFTALPCGILLFIVTKSTKERIANTSRLIKNLGENGNLESRIDISENDDFSAMHGKLNGFLDELSLLVENVQKESNRATGISSELQMSMEASRAVLEDMRNSMQIVSQGKQEQRDVIAAATHSVRKIKENAKNVESQVAIQSDALSQSSSAVSQMVANIRSVTELTEKANSYATVLKGSTATGTDALSEAVRTVNDIQTVSTEIQSTMQVIQKIASQTNILSMNAAIEAAHAGSFGTGFAVVANEVRNLASSSAASAKSIQSLIKTMIDKVTTGVAAINTAGTAFTSITENIDQTTTLIGTIAHTMEEQNKGASSTLDATKEVQSAITEIKNIAHMQSESAEAMYTSFQDIVASAEQVSHALAENEKNSNALGASIEAVGETVESSASAMEKIRDATSIFKLAEKTTSAS